jgi:hypothetical protein
LSDNGSCCFVGCIVFPGAMCVEGCALDELICRVDGGRGACTPYRCPTNQRGPFPPTPLTLVLLPSPPPPSHPHLGAVPMITQKSMQ